MTGTSVVVRTPQATEADRFGNEQYYFIETVVENVLVAPGATESLEASRPEGARVAYTLHFPKSFDGLLEGCEVVLPPPWDGVYRVIGNPMPYMEGLCPTRWNRTVEVEVAHG